MMRRIFCLMIFGLIVMKVDASEGSDDLKKDIDHKVTILENLPSIDQHYYYFNEYNEKFLMISKWHNATADLLYFYTMPPEEPIGSYSSTHYYLNYSGQVIMIKKYSYYDGGESMNEYFYFYNEKIFLYETESTNGEEKKITHSEKISELTEEHGIRVYLNKSEYFEFEDRCIPTRYYIHDEDNLIPNKDGMFKKTSMVQNLVLTKKTKTYHFMTEEGEKFTVEVFYKRKDSGIETSLHFETRKSISVPFEPNGSFRGIIENFVFYEISTGPASSIYKVFDLEKKSFVHQVSGRGAMVKSNALIVLKRYNEKPNVPLDFDCSHINTNKFTIAWYGGYVIPLGKDAERYTNQLFCLPEM